MRIFLPFKSASVRIGVRLISSSDSAIEQADAAQPLIGAEPEHQLAHRRVEARGAHPARRNRRRRGAARTWKRVSRPDHEFRRHQLALDRAELRALDLARDRAELARGIDLCLDRARPNPSRSSRRTRRSIHSECRGSSAPRSSSHRSFGCLRGAARQRQPHRQRRRRYKGGRTTYQRLHETHHLPPCCSDAETAGASLRSASCGAPARHRRAAPAPAERQRLLCPRLRSPEQ